MTTPQWPAPHRDDKTAEFFDAAADGRLLLKRCSVDDEYAAPEATGCDHCGGASLDWHPAAGTGELVTWSVVSRAPTAAHGEVVPYVVGIVELTEGPWLYARIVDSAQLAVGAAATAHFIHPDDGDSYPVFAVHPISS